MSLAQKKNKEELIKFILEYFGKPNKDELEKDIAKVKKIKESNDPNKELTKFVISFIDKYSKNELNSETCEKMTKEIIAKLINLRIDFLPLMNIYMLTKDEINSKILANHFVLKDKKPTKIEDDDIENAKLPFIQFGINLSCTYSKDSYYHKFIKGILSYFKNTFKDNYLKEYISDNYFIDIDKPKLYLDNDSTIYDSCNKMLTDMYRIVTEQCDKDTKEIKESFKPKIEKKKYQIFRIKAKLHSKTQFDAIYDNSDNNEDILSKLEKVLNAEETQSDDSLYSGIIILKDEIENFIKLEELNAFMHQVKSNKNTELFSLQKLNNDLIEENKKLKNKFDNLDNKYNTLVREKNELNTKVENLTKQINELNTKVENLTKQSNVLNTKVENLTKKVEIMESIILTLLYRKAKNYSINKFYL